MTNRRTFLKQAGIAGIGIAAMPSWASGVTIDKEYITHRPPVGQRKFVSKAVDAKIESVKKTIKDKELAWMFENCFPNTLDTTVRFSEKNGKPDTFVITGDIDAMWLRDSTAQVWPYLPLINKDPELKKLIQGVINRQKWCIQIDPYANAFNEGPGNSDWKSDITAMKDELHERKWEIDSLCYPIRLAYHYWKMTGDSSCFDAEWMKAMKLIVKTFREQQRKKDRGPYSFMRTTTVSTDTVPGGGWGNPVKPVGLICSAFRPSDDSTIFLFLIPSNYFALASLRQLSEMSSKIFSDHEFAAECDSFA
ncbi:MAG: glycoside hydrolase family 125 protein, partial [Bacteroidota bacterium]|nr:glycoside hydrolase family 125 protein [Bacteroidota bacterium]